MATERQIYTHENHNGTEIRNFSVEKLAAHPTGVGLYAGRIWELASNKGLYFSPDGTAVQRLVVDTEVERRVRFVGSLDVSSGTIPLVTPIADNINGETTWDAGDKGVVTVAGTLAPAPGGGNKVVQVGDVIMALKDNPTTNADFVIIESNLPTGLARVETLTVLPADFVGTAGAWVATKALSAVGVQAVSVAVRDATSNGQVQFGVDTPAGSVILTATTVTAPTGTYTAEVVVR